MRGMHCNFYNRKLALVCVLIIVFYVGLLWRWTLVKGISKVEIMTGANDKIPHTTGAIQIVKNAYLLERNVSVINQPNHESQQSLQSVSSNEINTIRIHEYLNTTIQSRSSLTNQTTFLLNTTNINGGEIISNASIILIVAYMRTGSTLTGGILQEHPGTFYAFEPIRTIYQQFEKSSKSMNTTLAYLHDKHRNYRYQDKDDVILDELKNWMSCRLDSLSIETLTDEFHGIYTKYMKQLYYCINGKYNIPQLHRWRLHTTLHLRDYYDTKSRIYMCLKRAINTCKKSPAIVLKFIRLRMRTVNELMPLFPNLKVLHLNRDPRGIFNSRLNLHILNTTYLHSEISAHCYDWQNDLSMSKHILQKYPKRLKIIQYEDIAETPLKTAKDIAEFTGLRFSSEMMQYIHNQTSSSRDTCSFCTQRKNSTLTASRWRLQIRFDHAQLIYNQCERTNIRFGYAPFTNAADVRNFSIPSRKALDVTGELLNDTYF